VLRDVGISALDGSGISAACPGQFTPETEPVVPVGYQDGCAVESVWMIWRRKKPLSLESNRDFGPAVRKLVTVLTESNRQLRYNKFFLWVLHVHQIY